MIKRYRDESIENLWSNENKVALWQDVELAVIQARVQLGQVAEDVFLKIQKTLSSKPVNINRWLELEEVLKHDLNAFVKERKENLPQGLRFYIHDQMTSYDTEEAAFALTLSLSCEYTLQKIDMLEHELVRLAKRYCFTPMNARTHGQEAEMQSFGAKCLTWLVELRLGRESLFRSMGNLKYSKLSGAIGKYGSISPELEEKALRILGLKPFFGATQIVPRGFYLSTAQALCQVTQAVNKIAHDIRLSARSGKPLMQEPFGKKQTGSSAMPHKKNTIFTEKIEGMDRLARGYLKSIEENSMTWEERAIEQSSCERVAWPDLFHVTVHSITTLTKVLSGLRVYPDNMLWEIKNSRGCYAAAQAKDWLKKYGQSVGIDEDSAYRIVQLAAFNAHEPCKWARDLRFVPLMSLYGADNKFCECLSGMMRSNCESIETIIVFGRLHLSDQLDCDEDQIQLWNRSLQKLFASTKMVKDWHKRFIPSYLLRNEPILFRKIIGWTPGSPK
ncbi:MAG: lyase family protein [Candidatus Paceibacterota bacterium]|jgi:adenylosuccinate lyase